MPILKDLSRQVAAAARSDRRRRTTAIAQRARDAFASGDYREAFARIRRLRPYKPQRPRGVNLEDGAPGPSPLRRRLCWQAHFARLLKGRPATFQDLQERARGAHAVAFGRAIAAVDTTLAFVPAASASASARDQGART